MQDSEALFWSTVFFWVVTGIPILLFIHRERKNYKKEINEYEKDIVQLEKKHRSLKMKYEKIEKEFNEVTNALLKKYLN